MYRSVNNLLELPEHLCVDVYMQLFIEETLAILADMFITVYFTINTCDTILQLGHP